MSRAVSHCVRQLHICPAGPVTKRQAARTGLTPIGANGAPQHSFR
jgi:hypothetical protein